MQLFRVLSTTDDVGVCHRARKLRITDYVGSCVPTTPMPLAGQAGNRKRAGGGAGGFCPSSIFFVALLKGPPAPPDTAQSAHGCTCTLLPLQPTHLTAVARNGSIWGTWQHNPKMISEPLVRVHIIIAAAGKAMQIYESSLPCALRLKDRDGRILHIYSVRHGLQQIK